MVQRFIRCVNAGVKCNHNARVFGNPDALDCKCKRTKNKGIGVRQHQIRLPNADSRMKVSDQTPLRRRLPNYTPAVHTAESTCALLLFESVPKTKSLVSSTCDYDLAIWAHCKVQHTVCMPCQRDNLLHTRVLPNNYLVLAVAMRRDNFIAVLGPGEVTNLTAGIEALQ